MNQHTRWLYAGSWVLLCASLLAPCFAGKAKVAIGQNNDLSVYKTYTWLPTKALTSGGIVENEPSSSPLIRSAVDRELTARGYKEVPEGGDLQVATFVLTAKIPQLEAVIFGGGVAFDYGTPVATMGRYNREGTLAINLIDSRTKKSAWAALITETIDTNQGGGLKKIAPATKKLFSKFPGKK